MLENALLKRYKLTEEDFKLRYNKCRPDSGATFQQFTSRLKSYFTMCVDMVGIEKTHEGLAELILRDQLVFICNKEIKLFQKEPEGLEHASKIADLSI